MDSKNIWKMEGAISAFLVLFIFFVPIPKIASLILLWIVVYLVTHILSGCYIFSFFISSTFVAILFIFLLIKSKRDNIEFRQAFIENFANDELTKEVPMNVDDVGTEEVKEDETKPEEDKKEDIIVREIGLKEYEDLDKPNLQEVKALKQSIPETPKKISMMDSDNVEDDVFGKLNADDFEDSDEDSDDDEESLEKKAGKTTVSSKQAYKAQKQLYDLTTAVSKLQHNMDALAPSLKKGQKIIESMQKMGISLI